MGIEEKADCLCDGFGLVAWVDRGVFTEAGSSGGEAKVKSKEQDIRIKGSQGYRV